jgi:hypothetical protein
MSHLLSNSKKFFPYYEAEGFAEASKTAWNRAEEAEKLAKEAKSPENAAEHCACAAWHRNQADRSDWQRITLILEGELGRIVAWDQIQKKKEEGEYPTFCSNWICSDVSCLVLQIVWMFLRAKEQAIQNRLTTMYVVNEVNKIVTVPPITTKEVIATVPVWFLLLDKPTLTPNDAWVYRIDKVDRTVFVIGTVNDEEIATTHAISYAYGIKINVNEKRHDYVTGSCKTVSVTSVDNYQVIATLSNPILLCAVAITRDGKRIIYVLTKNEHENNNFNNVLLVIQIGNNGVVTAIPLGSYPPLDTISWGEIIANLDQ